MATGEGADGDAIPADGSGPWPLTGRASEVAMARQALRDRRGVVFVGEPGTGKTRLASEIVASTGEEEGLRWHVVIGSAGAARVPLGAWSHLLPDSWEPGADDLATWRFLATNLEPSGDAIHLFVDDAQWLDPVSAGLVHHLVTTGQAKAAITVRRDAGVDQPITALWKDGHLVRHDLELLDITQTAAVLEAALGAPVEPRTVRRLHQRSIGNLLMLRELVDSGRQRGSLQLLHGAWVQHGSAPLGPRLRDLLAERIDGLAADERTCAELVAVGEPIATDLLSDVLPPELESRLRARRIIEVERVGEHRIVRCAHPLLGELLVDRMDDGRRDEVVRTLIDVFELAGAHNENDLLRIAVWRLDIGQRIEAGAAARAADLASARNDFTLAEELARVALAGGEGPAATIQIGEALQRQQRHTEAEAVFASLADQLDDLDATLRFRYAEGRALALSTDLGRLDDAIVVLEGTLATMPPGRQHRTLEARLAFVLSDCGRLRAAEPLADARLAGIDEDEVAALSALTAYALVRTMSCRGRDALDALDAMVPVAMRHLDEVPDGLGWIAAQRMLALHLLGEVDEVWGFSALAESFVRDNVDTTVAAAVLMVRGMLAADQGDMDHALRLLRQAAALHELDNRRGYQSWSFAIMARVHAQRGELDEAERALDGARRTIWPSGQVFGSELDSAAVWISALRGHRTEATELLDDAVARADAEGMSMTSAFLRHEAIRAGLDPAPHIGPLAATAAVDQGKRVSIWHAYAVALASHDGRALMEAGNRFATLGTHLVAAEAYARAASAHRRAGSPAIASQAKELSRQQRARCPGARSPALHLGDAVVGLTARELDTANRAAAGQTNGEIAEGLGISVRTVETHLQRAFTKLGVNRRTDLAAVLQPD